MANKLANYLWWPVLCLYHPAIFETDSQYHRKMKKPPHSRGIAPASRVPKNLFIFSVFFSCNGRYYM
jgi:hypothetical protein